MRVVHLYKSLMVHCIASCGSFKVHSRADVQNSLKTCMHVLCNARGEEAAKSASMAVHHSLEVQHDQRYRIGGE